MGQRWARTRLLSTRFLRPEIAIFRPEKRGFQGFGETLAHLRRKEGAELQLASMAAQEKAVRVFGRALQIDPYPIGIELRLFHRAFGAVLFDVKERRRQRHLFEAFGG